ncbi:MAG: dTMP kinase, partial [Thermodesulfobacteria bacterium]|nr:dTMP kinase [Thermodesulfobacteriota bacterium]
MHKLPQTSGKLVVIEGLDGSGSTTQLQLLIPWLRRQGYRVFSSREPSEGPVGKWLRQALQGRLTFADPALALLFLADRLDHAHGPEGFVSRLAEDNKAIMLSDRYYLSSFAYQTLNADISLDWLFQIHEPVPRPYVTFFVDTPPRLCLERIVEGRGYHFELYETALEKIETIREHYMKAIQYLRDRGDLIIVVDGDTSPGEIHRRIRSRLLALLEGADQLDELIARYPLVEEAVALLEEGNYTVIGGREIGAGIQLKFAAGDARKPATLHLYRSGNAWSQIVIQGLFGAERSQVERLLKPLQEKLWKQKVGEHPEAMQAKKLLEDAGFRIRQIRITNRQVVLHAAYPFAGLSIEI